MANVIDKIAQIRNAILGKDVRESLASGIEAINTETESTRNRQTTLETQFQEQIQNITLQDPSSAELVAARTKEDATTYPTLGERLNGIDSSLADIPNQEFITEKAKQVDLDITNSNISNLQSTKADQSFVDSQFASIVSGAPKGTYTDLLALKSAYPTGAEGIFLVLEDGHWYYWNGTTTEWTDGGVYQATEIPENAVTIEKTNFITTGVNLFNKDTITPNYSVSDINGTLVSNTSFDSSDYIDVLENTQYTKKNTSTYAFYNSNKVFISGGKGSKTFTTPINAKYVRYTIPKSNGIETEMLVIGSKEKSYEPYYFKFLKEKDKLENTFVKENTIPTNKLLKTDLYNIGRCGNNLIDRYKMPVGYSLNVNGMEVTNTGACTSNFIRINNYSILYAKRIFQYAFYDENYNFIEYSYNNLGTIQDIAIEVPNLAYYIKVVTASSIDSLDGVNRAMAGSGLLKSDSNLVPDYVIYGNDKKVTPTEILPCGKNLFDKNKLDGGKLLNSFGILNDSELHSSSNAFIKVDSNTEYCLSYAVRVIEFDKYKRVVYNSYITTDDFYTFTTSTDTSYVKISVLTTNKYICQLEKGSTSTFYESIKYALYVSGEKFIELDEFGGGTVDNELVTLDGYSISVNSTNYQIYQPDKASKKIVAIHGNIAVRTDQDLYSSISGDIGTIIEISTTGINGMFDTNVIFNDLNFPNLISNSKIHQIVIIPWTRNRTSFLYGYQWRMCILTDKGQIYHNFPSRSTTGDGSEVTGDIIRFEESVIWDLPTRKFPSKNLSYDTSEYYFPCLPDSCYELHPSINISYYGNGGFPKYLEKDGKIFPRFYQPNRIDCNTMSFRFMGGFEPTEKLTLLGTYNLNNTIGKGTRICVFATDDGGRSWYCKYDFADSKYGDSLTIGNNIDLSNVSGTYVEDSLKLNARWNVAPNDTNKNPTDKFIVRNDVVISDISKTNPAIITTKATHGINVRGLIAIKNNGQSSDFDWMCNNDFSTTNHGNGIFFKVEVIDETHLRLYEYVSSWDNNLSCRHIHCINKIKDGFTLGTGERYPDTWLFYIPMHEQDSSDTVTYAYKDLEFTRLNSSPNGLSRPLGFVIKDDAESTIYFASDESTTYRGEITLPNGEVITRNSIGVFKGKLEDIDDMSKFYPVFESEEPAFYFKEHNGAYVYFGQRGEFAISYDDCTTWSRKQFSGDFQKRNGFNNQFIVISGLIIALKQ